MDGRMGTSLVDPTTPDSLVPRDNLLKSWPRSMGGKPDMEALTGQVRGGVEPRDSRVSMLTAELLISPDPVLLIPGDDLLKSWPRSTVDRTGPG